MPTNHAINLQPAATTGLVTVEGEVVEDLWVVEANDASETTILIDTGAGVVKALVRGEDAALQAASEFTEGDRLRVVGYETGARRLTVVRAEHLPRVSPA